MSQWAFVAAAYGVTGAGTLWLIAGSWLAMRRAEAEATAVTRAR